MKKCQATRKAVTIFTLLLSVAAASAQPAPAPAQQSALPTEKVTVTGTKERDEAIQAFGKFVCHPHAHIGQNRPLGNRDMPNCSGMSDDDNKSVTDRLKEVAAKVGAPISTKKTCKPNIEIVFTTTPQALLDDVKKNQENFLGYHEGPEQRDRLATVTHPIQAWYTTATQDLNGKVQVDSTNGNGITINVCGPLAKSGATCYYNNSSAILTEARGSLIGNGLRSDFYNIIIVVGPDSIGDLDAVSDYVAMLALTQPLTLDSCPSLPTIMSLQAKDCEKHAERLTDIDMAYLEGVYKMDPETIVAIQAGEIADHMNKTLPKD